MLCASPGTLMQDPPLAAFVFPFAPSVSGPARSVRRVGPMPPVAGMILFEWNTFPNLKPGCQDTIATSLDCTSVCLWPNSRVACRNAAHRQDQISRASTLPDARVAKGTRELLFPDSESKTVMICDHYQEHSCGPAGPCRQWPAIFSRLKLAIPTLQNTMTVPPLPKLAGALPRGLDDLRPAPRPLTKAKTFFQTQVFALRMDADLDIPRAQVCPEAPTGPGLHTSQDTSCQRPTPAKLWLRAARKATARRTYIAQVLLRVLRLSPSKQTTPCTKPRQGDGGEDRREIKRGEARPMGEGGEEK